MNTPEFCAFILLYTPAAMLVGYLLGRNSANRANSRRVEVLYREGKDKAFEAEGGR